MPVLVELISMRPPDYLLLQANTGEEVKWGSRATKDGGRTHAMQLLQAIFAEGEAPFTNTGILAAVDATLKVGSRFRDLHRL